jgi:hypothetical protein
MGNTSRRLAAILLACGMATLWLSAPVTATSIPRTSYTAPAQSADAASCTTISDDFDRTVTGGWGTSDSGYTWETGGFPANVGVAAGQAYVGVQSGAGESTIEVLNGVPSFYGTPTHLTVQGQFAPFPIANPERNWMAFESAGYGVVVQGDATGGTYLGIEGFGGSDWMDFPAVDITQPWTLEVQTARCTRWLAVAREGGCEALAVECHEADELAVQLHASWNSPVSHFQLSGQIGNVGVLHCGTTQPSGGKTWSLAQDYWNLIYRRIAGKTPTCDTTDWTDWSSPTA